MATTSPDNLRTPDPGDPYNLVSDLATLAGDVQDALNDRGNAFKGTAAERAIAESSIDVGSLWVDTDGIKMIWRKGVSVFEPAVWTWAGTTTQRTAFTSAPDGFRWQDTNGGKYEFIRLGGQWVGGNYDSDLTMASGWSAVVKTLRVSAGRVELYIQGTRTGPDISVGATGDISNQLVATVNNPSLYPSRDVGAHSGRLGRVYTGGIVGGTGDLFLGAVGGSSDETTGRTFSFTSSYSLLVG